MGAVDGQPGRTVGSCRSPLTSGQTVTYLASSQGIVTTSLVLNSSTAINAVIIRGWNVATATSVSLNLTYSNNTLNPPSAAPNGLSSGAKAGIGIGATLGGIGILALIGAVFLLKRRQKATQYNHIDRHPRQADSNHVHEMSGQRPVVEMMQEPAELYSEAVTTKR